MEVVCSRVGQKRDESRNESRKFDKYCVPSWWGEVCSQRVQTSSVLCNTGSDIRESDAALPQRRSCSESLWGGELRWIASDSTLSSSIVTSEPPYTWELYSVQGRIRPLYRDNSCMGVKYSHNLHSTPNIWEAVLAREGNRFSKKVARETPRMLREEEGSVQSECCWSRGDSHLEN